MLVVLKCAVSMDYTDDLQMADHGVDNSSFALVEFGIPVSTVLRRSLPRHSLNHRPQETAQTAAQGHS